MNRIVALALLFLVVSCSPQQAARIGIRAASESGTQTNSQTFQTGYFSSAEVQPALPLAFPVDPREDARRIIATLTSRDFFGRGYLHDGMAKAARFIADELRTAGLKPLQGDSYFQDFAYPINTFPGKFEAKLNGVALQPGVDFIVTADSAGRKGTYSLTGTNVKDLYSTSDKAVFVRVMDKLTFSARQKALNTTEIQIDRKKFADVPRELQLNIESRFEPEFHAANLTAQVRGTQYPDQYLVLSAHYDHLGGYGTEAYFPGANDNASGTSFLLELAKYYQAHPQPYTMVFLFFAGEEAGLLGSQYFVAHPQIALKNIRFLFNFDMVGTGDTGATVVNSTIFQNQFQLLKNANAELQALPQIGERGESAASDHYSFYSKGVPCFFLYTTGGIAAYHDVFDRAETLPLTRFAELFNLVLRFEQKLSEQSPGAVH